MAKDQATAAAKKPEMRTDIEIPGMVSAGDQDNLHVSSRRIDCEFGGRVVSKPSKAIEISNNGIYA